MSTAQVTTTSTPQTQAPGDCVGATPIDRMGPDSFHALCVRPTVLADGTTFKNARGDDANVLATSSFACCASGSLRQAPMSLAVQWHNDTTVAKLNWCFDNFDGTVAKKLQAFLVANMPLQLTVEARKTFAEVQAENAALKAQLAAMPTMIAATK